MNSTERGYPLLTPRDALGIVPGAVLGLFLVLYTTIINNNNTSLIILAISGSSFGYILYRYQQALRTEYESGMSQQDGRITVLAVVVAFILALFVAVPQSNTLGDLIVSVIFALIVSSPFGCLGFILSLTFSTSANSSAANPPAVRIDERYNQISQKVNQQDLEGIDVPEPNTFDDYSKLSNNYDEIERTIDKWIEVSENYENIIDPTQIHSPNEFENYKQAYKKYKEISELGESIEQSIDISQKYRDKYPDLPFDTLLNSIIQSIESQGLPEKDQVRNWNQIAVESRDILTFLSEVDTSHLSINDDEWIDQIELALSEEYPNVLHPIHKKVKRMDGSLWEHSDFDSYTWQEFEDLVGSLYKSLGYETRVTSDTTDLGIDVWASKDGEQTAIQAKKYQQGNSVGRETLQKLASTLAKGDADHAVVITTSSFARTAEDYASEFGPDMEIIDGDKLIEMLNNSPLAPPV